MINVTCQCGTRFQVLNETVAERARCPKCGRRAADSLSNSPAAEPEFIPCVHHPEQPATHNCLNCGKTLCMECVRVNGYYCGAECREAVASAEPDAVSDEQREAAAVAQEMGQAMQRAAGPAKKIAWAVGVAALLVCGWFVMRAWFAPKGQVTATLPVSSAMASFGFIPSGKDAVVVQANRELSLVSVPALKKTWTVALEEGAALLAVRGATILVQSSQQVIALDRSSGGVRWKFGGPDGWLDIAAVHDQGVWCRDGKGAVNVRLDTGEPACVLTNRRFGELVCVGEQTLMLTQLIATDAEEVTAGSIHDTDVTALLKRRRDLKPVDYELEIFETSTGRVAGRKTLRLPPDAEMEAHEGAAFVRAGRELLCLEPEWRVTLPEEIESVTRRGDCVAVATAGGAVALDAATGQQRWYRAGLDVQRIVIGPDGAVYATVYLTKDAVGSGEAADYRGATVATTSLGALPVYSALVKLDGKTGATLWGVRNIGRQVLFEGEKVFVVDNLVQTDLLANNLTTARFSVRRISARTGKDDWQLLRRGSLFHQHVTGGKALIVAADQLPTGRGDPVCNYELRLVEGR